jgi:hypothetical protein|tara:strand:+ start:189 stop:413 length:225 start_codon:yes stop_codon:yes gene_type:complete
MKLYINKEEYLKEVSSNGLKPKFRKFTFEAGQKYETILVGSRMFKLKVAGKAELDEFIADGKLTAKQFYKKYPK